MVCVDECSNCLTSPYLPIERARRSKWFVSVRGPAEKWWKSPNEGIKNGSRDANATQTRSQTMFFKESEGKLRRSVSSIEKTRTNFWRYLPIEFDWLVKNELFYTSITKIFKRIPRKSLFLIKPLTALRIADNDVTEHGDDDEGIGRNLDKNWVAIPILQMSILMNVTVTYQW